MDKEKRKAEILDRLATELLEKEMEQERLEAEKGIREFLPQVMTLDRVEMPNCLNRWYAQIQEMNREHEQMLAKEKDMAEKLRELWRSFIRNGGSKESAAALQNEAQRSVKAAETDPKMAHIMGLFLENFAAKSVFTFLEMIYPRLTGLSRWRWVD